MDMSYKKWVEETQKDIDAGLLCPRCASVIVEDEDGIKGCTSCDYTVAK